MQSQGYVVRRELFAAPLKWENHMISVLFFLVFLQSPPPSQGVMFRTDGAMGFSRETVTPHFRLYNSGGAIEVYANDSADAKTRDGIRLHLAQITKMFRDGNFSVPLFIHNAIPPGTPTMSKLHDQIRYIYSDMPQGAKISIASKNKEAVDAVHDFLRFQITDHKTGDSLDIRPRR
jgi:hypothetical protein